MIKDTFQKIKQTVNNIKHKDLIAVGVIILIGCIVRIAEFGSIPCGLNQDEAFAGYEAYSILNYGTDSWASERKAAHRGDSGFYWFFTVVVCTASEVYFQLQTGDFLEPQRLFRFSSSTAEEAKQYRCYTSVTAL